MSLKLSNGHTVQIAKFCTRGTQKKIQKALFESGTIGTDVVSNPDKFNISVEGLHKQEEVALTCLVEKITDEQGNEIAVNIEYFDNLSVEDFEKVKEQIDGLIQVKESLGKE